MAFIISIDGELSGRRFPLNSPLLVGRGPYNHVVLDDARISRQHCKISPEQGGYVIYDLNSVNGTYVNDVPVRRKMLEANDLLRFGPFAFRFEGDGEPEVTRPVGRPEPNRVVEVRTIRGIEPVAEIVGSLDAASGSSPNLTVGLNELEDAYRKLRTIYVFMQSISATLDTHETLGHIAQNLLDLFPTAECVTAYLPDPTSHLMVPRLALPRHDRVIPETTMPAQIHEQVIDKGRAILIAPPSITEKKKPVGGVSMYAPLIHRGTTQGVIHVKSSEAGPRFVQSDLDLLIGMAAPAGMALQNARMHQESLIQQRLQHDLLLAEQIQKSFLPRQLPSVEGIEFITEYRPAYSVGGDFYDIFWLSPDRLGLFIGDVSGKGISAALLMARISSDLRVAALAETEPARAMASVNQLVMARRQHDIFFTGIYFTLDVKRGEIVLANAGHPPPYIRRGTGALEKIEAGTSTAVGVLDNVVYEQAFLRLNRGDSIVLCTDGVIEATDGQGQQFGFERLEQSLAGGSSRAADLAKRLLTDVRRHVGEAPRNDDLTLLVCGLAAPPIEIVPTKSRRDEPTSKTNVAKRRNGR